MKSKKSKITNKNNKNTLKKQKGGVNSAPSGTKLSTAAPLFVPGAKPLISEFTEEEILNLHKLKLYLEIVNNIPDNDSMTNFIKKIKESINFFSSVIMLKFVMLTNVQLDKYPPPPNEDLEDDEYNEQLDMYNKLNSLAYENNE